jgi:mono/diheme cytochrome c family protein
MRMRRFLRVLGLTLGAVLVLMVLAGAAAYVMGGRAWDRTYEVPTADLTIPTDEASVARGRHFAGIYGCVECHGQDLGGAVIADAPPFFIAAPNLTAGRGGIGGAYTPVDWERSIRHGVRPNGQSLFIMPARAYHHVADRDIADLIAYLRRVPPVDRELPAREIRPLGRLLGAGPMDPSFEVMDEPARTDAPPPGPTAEYGAYLTSICGYCHGDGLRGMQPPDPDAPLAPDLGAAGQWPFEVFEEVLRTGVRPDGTPLNPAMPWQVTARMTESELRAIYAHLQTLGGARPAVSEGG